MSRVFDFGIFVIAITLTVFVSYKLQVAPVGAFAFDDRVTWGARSSLWYIPTLWLIVAAVSLPYTPKVRSFAAATFSLFRVWGTSLLCRILLFAPLAIYLNRHNDMLSVYSFGKAGSNIYDAKSILILVATLLAGLLSSLAPFIILGVFSRLRFVAVIAAFLLHMAVLQLLIIKFGNLAVLVITPFYINFVILIYLKPAQRAWSKITAVLRERQA
ncbi:MAG: hypothetical protein ABFD64_01395 [Armatimonadota bacterium]